MPRSALFLCSASLASLLTTERAHAQGQAQAQRVATASADAPSATATASTETSAKGQEQIVVTGRRLDVARDAITPSLGASQYTFNREALEKQPGGTNLSLNKSLLQAPGVTQDSYGTIHVRNEHANLQYRLNGVIVPESISGFGTTFDPRIASSIQLITGTLPAQYGYRTAGVINFKTQSGLLDNGGEIGRLRRQLRLVRAERDAARLNREPQLLPVGQLPAQRHRDRKPAADAQCDSRPHDPGIAPLPTFPTSCRKRAESLSSPAALSATSKFRTSPAFGSGFDVNGVDYV